MEPISAQSPGELLAVLGQIDISVPLRTEGRRTPEHCEPWSICRFLASFADSDLLEYPLCVIHGDKPDFLLEHPPGKCGIEVTEVVPTNYASIHAYREHKGINGPFFLQRFHPGEPKLRNESLRSRASS
ncbi:MAG: hypothetical protein M3Z21_13675, partial [Pseudomonadota bacterium]|nr:hypothetical protein [Pseudomonadota bacterium]